MLEQKITFDRFVRWALALGFVGVVVWLVNRLSGVLLPFFVAWLVAYMLYPLVCFVQYRLRFRNRVVSIIAALLLVLAVLGSLAALIIPPMIEETMRLVGLVSVYFSDVLEEMHLSRYLNHWLVNYADGSSVLKLVQQSSFIEAMERVLIEVWGLVAGTIDFIWGCLSIFVVLLYLFFILLDYERISEGWVSLIPSGKRRFAMMVVQDVKSGMNAYFRGQTLVAFCVGVLFSIGFLIIDFPLAVGLGLFLGFLNLVPYMQLVGFVPTIVLAAVKASDTGESFWLIMLSALVVFAVVQVIQDVYLTPRIMGKVMGMNPAVILLSLSVWGSLLGIIGLIVALPLTTFLLSYYRRFVLKEEGTASTPEKGSKPRGRANGK